MSVPASRFPANEPEYANPIGVLRSTRVSETNPLTGLAPRPAEQHGQERTVKDSTPDNADEDSWRFSTMSSVPLHEPEYAIVSVPT